MEKYFTEQVSLFLLKIKPESEISSHITTPEQKVGYSTEQKVVYSTRLDT